MAVGDAYVFPGFLTPVLTQLFFPKPPTTFLTCFCRGERRKYTGKKSRLNRGSNSQPPGHESDTLTTEPPRRGLAAEEADDKSNFSRMRTNVPEMIENIVGQENCADYWHFFAFSSIFQNLVLQDRLQSSLFYIGLKVSWGNEFERRTIKSSAFNPFPRNDTF